MKEQLRVLEQRRQRLLRALADAKKARDEADSKMQSRYDTQKEDAAQDVATCEALIAEVDKLVAQLEASGTRTAADTASDVAEVGRRVTIEFDDGERGEFLLLDSQGGVDLGGYQTLSARSPVGNAVIGARAGETVCVEMPAGSVIVRIVDVS